MATAKSTSSILVAKSTDNARIKKLQSTLAKAAVSATEKGYAGSVGASNLLHSYAQRHAKWLEARYVAE